MNQFDQLSSIYDLDMREKTDGISMYLRVAKVLQSPILQLGCGLGRLLLPIASQGLEIHGVEPEAELLNFLRAEINAGPPEISSRITLFEQPISEFRTDQKFNLVMIAFDAFLTLLTREDQRKTLQNTREMLSDDGLLLIDITTPKHEELANDDLRRRNLPAYRGLLHDEESGNTYVRNDRIKIDLTNQISEVEMIYDIVTPGVTMEKSIRTMRMRYIFRNEMELLLENSGFEIIDFFNNYNDQQPYSYDESNVMVFAAQPK